MSLTRPLAGLVLLVLATAGCGEDPPGLFVDVRTDLRPGYEFTRVRVELIGASTSGNPRAEAAARTGDDEAYLRGHRVAELPAIVPSQASVHVALLDGLGRTVLERTAAFRIESKNRVVTVVMTRDCRDVECPAPDGDPNATACLAGMCVAETCTPETPELCPAPQCTADTDCAAASDCSVGRCSSGTCLQVARDELCSAGSFCSPGEGCVEVEPMDAGVPEMDATMPFDATAPDAGDDAGTDAGEDPRCVWLVGADAGATDGGAGDAGDTSDAGMDAGGTGVPGTCAMPLDLSGMSMPDGTFVFYGEIDAYPNEQRGSCSCPTCTGGSEVVFRFVPPIDVLVHAITDSWVEPSGWRDTVLYARTVCDDPSTEIGCNDDEPSDVHSNLNVRVRGGEPVYLMLENFDTYAGFDRMRVTLTALLAAGSPCDPTSIDRRCGFDLECRSEAGAPAVCHPIACGDGRVEGTESCDDGNADPCDGCSPSCEREGGSCAVPIDLGFAGAMQPDGSIVFRSTTYGARDVIDGSCRVEDVSPELVHVIRPTMDGVLEVSVDTTGTGYAPVVAVLTACEDPATEIACNAASWTNRVAATTADVRAGESYFVVVETYNPDLRDLFDFDDRTYTLTARVTPPAAPP